tara:strand:+ start:3417 stop:4631 length:1215 start_codon:yes stop_codon:yes gene_type:complete
MSEIIKVFKNVNTQNHVGAATSLTLASTTASQQAVIKDVTCPGVRKADLDLDGFTIMSTTGTDTDKDLNATGNLIMGPSSTLSIKFPLVGTPSTQGFEGMFFSDGSDTHNYMVGDGVGSGLTTKMTSIVNFSTAGDRHCDSATACDVAGVATFFRQYAGTCYMYQSITATTQTAQFGFGSGNSQGLTNDGTYLYTKSQSNDSTIYRRHIVNAVSDTLTAGSNFEGQGANQGSFFLHHNGYLYSKYSGTSSIMSIMNLSTLAVTSVASTNVGSYSCGACVVTNLAGESYIVEQGTNYWQYYLIGGSGGFTQMTGSSSSSTEYGNGGAEVAPGVAWIFDEHSDDLCVIDMNTKTWVEIATSSQAATKGSVHDAFSNRIGFCGILRPQEYAVNYDAYCSGILITDGA